MKNQTWHGNEKSNIVALRRGNHTNKKNTRKNNYNLCENHLFRLKQIKNDVHEWFRVKKDSKSPLFDERRWRKLKDNKELNSL
jgi:hypothetical protein